MAGLVSGVDGHDGQGTFKNNSSGAVKSATRTVELLEVLAQAPHRLTLTELAARLRYPKSSLHQLLRTLETSGWVETDERGTAYGIGVRALLVGTAYLDRDLVTQFAGPHLEMLRTELQETVHLARLDGADVVYLASRESSHHLRTGSRIGRRLPAHATSLGKILLAQRTPAEVHALLPAELAPLTPFTIVDREQLDDELQAIRLRQWSTEEQENTLGLGCIAVAVPFGRPATYAISCSVPLVRLTEEHHAEILQSLLQHVDDLGSLLRHSPTS